MHVLPQQKGSLDRVLSSVCFIFFPDALNIPVPKKNKRKKKKKILPSYILWYTVFSQSVSKYAMLALLFPALEHKALA